MRGAKIIAGLDAAAALLAVAVGVGQLGFAVAIYGGLSPGWIWFLAGGLMALYVGVLNLALIWNPASRALRWSCFWCNVTFLMFVTLAISTDGLGETPLYAAAIAAPLLTSLSLTPR